MIVEAEVDVIVDVEVVVEVVFHHLIFLVLLYHFYLRIGLFVDLIFFLNIYIMSIFSFKFSRKFEWNALA